MASGIKAVTKTEKDNPASQTEELAFRPGLEPKQSDENTPVFYSFQQQMEETYRTKK